MNDLPFDGEISRFFEEDAPDEVREAVRSGDKDRTLAGTYPYDEWLSKKKGEKELERLQIELVRLQGWLTETGERLMVIFEGRDAAGKGGAIRRVRANLDSRHAHAVALGTPSEREASQWYFQRYVDHLPAGGDFVIFDRSWYNRGVVEKVFGFCTDEEREAFFHQAPRLEKMLVEDGIHLRKIWLNVGRAEQMRRMLDREKDPLKQWKLSRIDVEGLGRWDAYSDAIRETFERTHTEAAPWTVIRGDDKRRARIAVIRAILHGLPYDGRDEEAAGPPDPKIVGGPEIWSAA